MEKKCSRSASGGGGGARTRDLPRARRGSPDARQGGGLFRQANLSVPIEGRSIAQHHVLCVLEIVFVRFCKILLC